MTSLLLNWVLTAAFLIAFVLFLRAAFGKHISARLRYALWAVVLVRLLVPVQLFAAPIEAPQVFPVARMVQTFPNVIPERENRPIQNTGDTEVALPVQTMPVSPAPDNGVPVSSDPEARKTLDYLTLLGGVWLGGTAVATLALLWANLRFVRRLRRVRIPLAGTGCPLMVYITKGLPSPCLFGVVRPAVYLTPEAAADPTMLRHVLVHEATHFHHGDHIWSFLRCVALAIHWWNPLVWLATVLSRQDAELACDEGALKRLGDHERSAYGGTLLTLVTVEPQPADLLCCATTMTGTKRSLRERVGRIAHASKRWLWAAVLVAVLSALVCVCAFAKTIQTPEDRSLTQEELDYFNSEIFNGGGFNIRNQFLYFFVEAPEDYRQIDLYQLFYNGIGEADSIYADERQAVADAARNGVDPGTDLIKCSATEIDKVLREYLGLSLKDSEKHGLDNFTYLPKNAYTSGYAALTFTNVLGHQGFRIESPRSAAYYASDYYIFDENGVPRLLAGCANEIAEIDMDGNGEKELLWNYHGGREVYLYFRRDGEVYSADIYNLIRAAWPEAEQMELGYWKENTRYLSVIAQVSIPGSDIMGTVARTLWFDGKNLRLYKDETPYGYTFPLEIETISEDNVSLIGKEAHGSSYTIYSKEEWNDLEHELDEKNLDQSSMQIPENPIRHSIADRNYGPPASIQEIITVDDKTPGIIVPNGAMGIFSKGDALGWACDYGDKLSWNFEKYPMENGAIQMLGIGYIQDGVMREMEVFSDTLSGKYEVSIPEKGVYHIYVICLSSDPISLKEGEIALN